MGVTPEQISEAVAIKKLRKKNHAAALKQANADERVTPEDPVMDTKKGEQMTLHQLNHNAKQRDYAVRDNVRAAAVAAATAVSNVLKKGVAGPNRIRKAGPRTQARAIAKAAQAAGAK